MFDSLSISMLIPITFISMLVHIYAIGYMMVDNHQQRFFSYLSLFTFFMIVLVTGENLLVMFVGWEGVGVCSYLLINFWFTRMQANKAAMSAIITNRVGDMFLTIGMFMVLYLVGSLDYGVIFSSFYLINKDIILIVGMLFLLGAMAKSAQIGLHQWLPLAMEAPTPVSALLHAATMVTAGVYLLIRISPIIEYSSTLLLIIVLIGGVTSILASLVGLYQNDIKKVIAYSTCSQLGMMFIAVGLSQYSLGLYHLFNHAFFKALLFLGAGSVIHGMMDDQDMRRYGGLSRYMVFTRNMLIIGSLSLMAMPYLTGYYSKDFIIESLYGNYSGISILVFYIALFGSFVTSLYSVKVLYRTFFSKRLLLNNKKVLKGVHEPVLSMGIPLLILGFFSIVIGYILKDLFVGIGSNYLDRSVLVLPIHYNILEIEFGLLSNLMVKVQPLIYISLSVVFYFILLFIDRSGIILGLHKLFIKSIFRGKLYKRVRGYYLNIINVKRNIVNLFNNKFYYEYFINKYVIYKYLGLSYVSYKYIDQGVLEIKLHSKILDSLYKSGNFMMIEKESLENYLLYMFIGLLVILLCLWSDLSIIYCILLYIVFVK